MFDILFTHPDFLLINKHPNVSVHKDDGDTMLLQEVATQTGDGQLYLVHRLDKMTSGILLLARNATAASELSQGFAKRKVEKFYLAIGSKSRRKTRFDLRRYGALTSLIMEAGELARKSGDHAIFLCGRGNGGALVFV